MTENARIAKMNLLDTSQDNSLLRVSRHAFYNVSKINISMLVQSDIKNNLINYIQTLVLVN